MNKRILILCEAIAPPAYSPRIITLVEWLQAHGWHCEIATEMDDDTAWESTVCKVHQMPTYRRLVADKVLGAKEKAFVKYIQQHIDVNSFDLIFCGSYYYFPLQAAKRLAEIYRLPLVVDLRDITEQWGKLDYYTRRFTGIQCIDRIAKGLYTYINTQKRNHVLRGATAVTTVSPWHQRTLAQYNPNTHLIYNGYDAHTFYPKTLVIESFDITFIGKYYSHYQDCPRLLFAALQSLIATNQIAVDEVKVHFYTNAVGQADFAKLAKEYTLDNVVRVHNYIPRSEIVDRMHHSSIMLVLTTPIKQYGTHGMMGTKFYEILGVEKPCLCLNSDEECLAEAIKNTHAGLAATHVEDVKAFILEKYQEWKANGYTHQLVINKEQFTRQHEAEQFEQVFLQCIK
jgi:glycosyltransferase involved in cell wall biosynthesis